MKEDKLYLRHILDAIKKIEKYLRNQTYEKFKSQDLLYDGVLMELIVIGEEVNHLSEEFQEKYSKVPWHKVSGMRNRISHEYHGVKAKIIWDTCQKDLPKFKRQVEILLK